MRPKRRTKSAPSSRYRYGTSSSSDVSGAESGRTSRQGNKEDKDNAFSKTKMAINMLSQQYMTRESSGCDGDTENSTAESGQYDFDLENNFTLFLSPKRKSKKPKKPTKKKPAAKGKKQNKMDTENDHKLKRKFSSLGISDSDTVNMTENTENIQDQCVQKKKLRPSVVSFNLDNIENMDFDEDIGDGLSKDNDLFISPIGRNPSQGFVKTKRFTAIKKMSTPATSKPVLHSSDDGCFGFDSIDGNPSIPDQHVGPSRSKDDDLFISPIGRNPSQCVVKTKQFTSFKKTSTPAESKSAVHSSDDGCFGFDSIGGNPGQDMGPCKRKDDDLFISPIGGNPSQCVVKTKRFTSFKETSTPAESKPVVYSSDDGCFGFDSIMSPEPEVSPVRKISSMEYITSRPSMSPTDLGSPDLKPSRKPRLKKVDSKPRLEIVVSEKKDVSGLRRSKRSSVLSSLMSSPPPKQEAIGSSTPETEETSTEAMTDEYVPPARFMRDSSISPVSSGSSKRRKNTVNVKTENITKNLSPKKKRAKINKAANNTNLSPKRKRRAKLNRTEDVIKNLSPKKKGKTKSKPSPASVSSTPHERSKGLMVTLMDSGIAMSFQDSNAFEEDDGLFTVLSSTEEETKPTVPTNLRPTKKTMTKSIRPPKTNEKDEKKFDQWASMKNDDFSEIEMFELVISS